MTQQLSTRSTSSKHRDFQRRMHKYRGRPIHLVWPLESNPEVWCSNLGSDAIWGPALAGVNSRIKLTPSNKPHQAWNKDVKSLYFT